MVQSTTGFHKCFIRATWCVGVYCTFFSFTPFVWGLLFEDPYGTPAQLTENDLAQSATSSVARVICCSTNSRLYRTRHVLRISVVGSFRLKSGTLPVQVNIRAQQGRYSKSYSRAFKSLCSMWTSQQAASHSQHRGFLTNCCRVLYSRSHSRLHNRLNSRRACSVY